MIEIYGFGNHAIIREHIWLWLISLRGDGKDYSAFHIIDIENNTQVAEYRGQLGTKEFGHLLVGIATEYNEALFST